MEAVLDNLYNVWIETPDLLQAFFHLVDHTVWHSDALQNFGPFIAAAWPEVTCLTMHHIGLFAADHAGAEQ